jgi:hypothetical protein
MSPSHKWKASELGLSRLCWRVQSFGEARYHDLVMALIQKKPVVALSDHAELDTW